jgi:hypothetical protein
MSFVSKHFVTLRRLRRQTLLAHTPKVRVIAESGGECKLRAQNAIFWHYWRIGRDFEQKARDKFLWQFASRSVKYAKQETLDVSPFG